MDAMSCLFVVGMVLVGLSERVGQVLKQSLRSSFFVRTRPDVWRSSDEILPVYPVLYAFWPAGWAGSRTHATSGCSVERVTLASEPRS